MNRIPKVFSFQLILLLMIGFLTFSCSKKTNEVDSGNQVPEVITSQITNITLTTAVGGGICSDKGSPVTSRGICYSTSPHPTTDSQKTSDGAGAGAFNSNLSNLQWNTKYFVRAYAINGYGTGYGTELSFTTLSFIVNTLPVTDITSTSSTCGGQVETDGGGEVVWVAIHWDTIPNLSFPFRNTLGRDVSAGGNFTFSLTNLIPNTIYYVKAEGEIKLNGWFLSAYGNEVSFSTLGSF